MNDVEHPKLIVTEGPLAGKSYSLSSKALGIGRDADNQIIIIGDEKVSRHHCRIINHLDRFWLEDLKSTNGTFLIQPGNLEMTLTPFQPALLSNSARVKIGSSQFELMGVKQDPDDTVQMLALQLQELMQNICEKLPVMKPEEREAYESAIGDLTDALLAAQSEDELIKYVGKKIQSLSAGFLSGNHQQATVMFDPAFELPPLPDDLSRLNQVARVDSLKNMFISDIQRCLPPDEDEGNHATD
jgi:hypothetical protein